MQKLLLILAGAILAAAACDGASPAPTLMPENAPPPVTPPSAPPHETAAQEAASTIEVGVQDRTSKIQLLQDDAPLPVENGEVHLKRKQFSVRVRGNLDVCVVASKSDTLVKSLAAGKRALAYVIASNFAYDKGALYLNEKADLIPWEKSIQPNDPAEKNLESILRNHFNGELPNVLNCGQQWQCAFAPNGADECTFDVTKLSSFNDTLNSPRKDRPQPKEIPWSQTDTVQVVFIATAPMDGKLFEFAGWKSLKVTLGDN